MSDTGAVRTHLIIAIVVVIMGAAYLVFLAATWQQLQNDRRASFAKVDAILDRIPPLATEKKLDNESESA